MLRVLVSIFILISVHDLFNIGQIVYFFKSPSPQKRCQFSKHYRTGVSFHSVRPTDLTQIHSVRFHRELAGTKQNSPL